MQISVNTLLISWNKWLFVQVFLQKRNIQKEPKGHKKQDLKPPTNEKMKINYAQSPILEKYIFQLKKSTQSKMNYLGTVHVYMFIYKNTNMYIYIYIICIIGNMYLCMYIV